MRISQPGGMAPLGPTGPAPKVPLLSAILPGDILARSQFKTEERKKKDKKERSRYALIASKNKPPMFTLS